MTDLSSHGYIDFVGDEEWFWRIQTLWKAVQGVEARETPLDDIPWREDGCFILGEDPTWEGFAEHCRRSREADFDYPIILGPSGEVMDGMHRIVRAFVEGRRTLPAVVLTEVPAPDRVRKR